jgi:ethanolamine utilization protein EutN
MQLGRVMGTATATVKHPTFEGERLLVVQLENAAGGPDGEPVLAFDRLGARRGDLVLLTNDGAALQGLLGATTPGRWSVMGIPD